MLSGSCLCSCTRNGHSPSFLVVMEVEMSFILSGFTFPPLTLISLKVPDFNINITMSTGNPQLEKSFQSPCGKQDSF